MSMGAIGAAVAGSVVTGMMSDGGGGTTTTSNAPWMPYQPYLKTYAGDMNNMIGTMPYYPGDTVANLTPAQMTGMGMTTNAADQLTNYNNALGSQMNYYMSPEFMDPNKNPYMQDYVNAAIDPLTNVMNDQMADIRGTNRLTGGSDYGSTRQGVSEGIAMGEYYDAVGNTTANIYTDLYGQNQQAQLATMGMSPMYAQMMSAPGAMYGGVGSQQQMQNQAEIQGEMDAYNYTRDQEWDQMMSLMGMMQGSPYSERTTTNPDGSGGDIANMLGGAALGWSVYDNFTTPTTYDPFYDDDYWT